MMQPTHLKVLLNLGPCPAKWGQEVIIPNYLAVQVVFYDLLGLYHTANK